MTTTKRGREVLGHHCTYSCDCDCEWIELDPEPLDSSHCPQWRHGTPSTFAAVMVAVAAGGLLAMGVAVVLLNWMGVL